MRTWWTCSAFVCAGLFLGNGDGMQCRSLSAQETNPNRRYDPVTGITYERQVRVVEQPVTETKLEPKTVTISRPEVVTETEPVTQNYWTPVVRYEWQPRWRGLWNPFAPATLEYQYVPQTRWESRSETYSRLKTSTRWVSEQKVVNEPRLVTSVQRKQVEEWVAVGRSVPQSPSASGYGDASRIASLPPSPAMSPTASLRSIPSGGLGSGMSTAPLRPTLSAGLPPTVLDPYSTRYNSSGTIFR